MECCLISMSQLSEDDVSAFLHEFKENDEECNVLWQLSEQCFNDWIMTITKDHSTAYAALTCDGCFVGVCRLTENPNHKENGMFGYAIRPSERHKGFGKMLALMAAKHFFDSKHELVTACVDIKNITSRKCLEVAGFRKTGTTYSWTGGRIAIEYAWKSRR